MARSVNSTRPNGADFSSCRKYRYRLWRTWDGSDRATERPCLFILLNPSTADEYADDPTVQRCRSFAQSWGFGGMEVVNLFAFRSTDPTMLRSTPHPVGPSNDTVILAAIQRAGRVVCAWGSHGTLHGRGVAVTRMLQERNVRTLCFRLTRTGQPVHPSRLPRASALVLYTGADGSSSMGSAC